MEPTLTPTLGTTGTDDTLLGILQKISALQSRPIIPDNPSARLFAGLAGFGAAVQGKPNPVFEMAKSQREQELEGLKIQLTGAGIQRQIEDARWKQTEALRDNARDVYKATRQGTTAENLAGLRGMVQTGQLDLGGADLAMVAAEPEYEKKRDQLVAVLQEGGNPFGPEWGAYFPKPLFGGLSVAVQNAITQGGPLAANRFRVKPEAPENVFKAHLAAISVKPEENRTDTEKRLVPIYENLLKLGPEHLPQHTQMFRAIKQSYLSSGNPVPPDDVLHEMAATRLREQDSVTATIARIADRKNLSGDARDQFILNSNVQIQAAIRKAVEGGLPLSPATQERMDTLKTAYRIIHSIATDFTPEERARYTGFLGLKLKGRQFNQVLEELSKAPVTDLKLNHFVSLTSQARELMFGTGGKALTPTEISVVKPALPLPETLTSAQFETNLRDALGKREMLLGDLVRSGITSKDTLEAALSHPQGVAVGLGLAPLGASTPVKTTPGGRLYEVIKNKDGSLGIKIR